MNKGLIEWIKSQRPGPFASNLNQPTSNVFIADFIELNNFEFCRAVIGLNEKLIIDSNVHDCSKSNIKYEMTSSGEDREGQEKAESKIDKDEKMNENKEIIKWFYFYLVKTKHRDSIKTNELFLF